MHSMPTNLWMFVNIILLMSYQLDSVSVDLKSCGSTSHIKVTEFRYLIHTALASMGYSKEDVDITTETLLYAEMRGNNQGIVKLLSGALRPNPSAHLIQVTRETGVSASVDGGQRIGMAVLDATVNVAIRKARLSGIGIVSASNYSSATGAIGIWARKVAQEGYVGIVLSQCEEMVAPHGSYEAIFGTNPIAIAVPTKDRPVVLDMATSAAAYFSLVSASREGRAIPDNIAYDDMGRETNDPLAAMGGALRVFGNGPKGSGLALMVELLAGALTGAAMTDKKASGNWGSLVIAIDPSLFGSTEDFLDRVEAMCNRVKNAKKLPNVQEILLPGEGSDIIDSLNRAKDSVEISAENLATLRRLAGVAVAD